MVVDRFKAEDREATEALYRRVFGPDAAEASRLRWDWQYRKNPNNPGRSPLIWVARVKPMLGEVRLLRRFDRQFTDLWRRVGPKFDLAVRRDAEYLQWKFVTPPHVRYTIASLQREDGPAGYIVYRHAHEPRGRVT